MPLNELSLEELTELAGTLDQVRDAGVILAAYGLHPIFNLTPGQDATITLPFRMPEAPGLTGKWVMAEPAQAMSGPWNGTTDLPASTEAAQPEPAPAPVEPALVPGEVTGAGALSAEPSRSGGEADPPPAVAEASPPPLAKAAPPEAQADSGGGVAVAAADSAPAATHERTFTRGPDWTAEEDERLIERVVRGVGRGATKKAAMISAAHELGRPEAATQFRCHHKLKARIDAALTAAAMHQAQTETPEIPGGPAPANATDGPTASAGNTAVGGHSPAAVQDDVQAAMDAIDDQVQVAGQLAAIANEIKSPLPMPNDPITAYLIGLTDKGGWTVERDLELMELSIAGWQPNEIALQLQMQANAVKPRFDTLTGLHEDTTGKKVRRFTREDVFAALTRLAGKAA
jgi:hypothetical protein